MKEYICTVCGYKTNRKSSMTSHINRKRPCVKPPRVKPPEKPQTTTETQAPETISTNTSSEFDENKHCPICKKNFSVFEKLQKHIEKCQQREFNRQIFSMIMMHIIDCELEILDQKIRDTIKNGNVSKEQLIDSVPKEILDNYDFCNIK